jgi:hypothetical protein
MTRQPVDREFLAIIERIKEHVGSYRQLSLSIDVAPDVFSRAMRGTSGLAVTTVQRLVALYGDAFGFSEADALRWCGFMTRDVEAAAARSGVAMAPEDYRALMRELDETERQVEKIRARLAAAMRVHSLADGADT